MRRRTWLTWAAAAAGTAASAQPQDPAALLQRGGCVVLLRHAQTVSGVGDPAGFRIDICSTQRNLSEAGREQSRRIGQWFSARNLKPAAVRTSAWCRCIDTADLAFGRHVLWPPLNSTFNDRALQPDQTDAVRASLRAARPGQFDVWVTHQVNISALTGEGPSMGEAFILDNQGKIMARTAFV
jgi:phosphohistidine phosphatase SixA